MTHSPRDPQDGTATPPIPNTFPPTAAVIHDGDATDTFGYSVALADDRRTALVGAVGEEDPNDVVGDLAGAVFAFERADGE